MFLNREEIEARERAALAPYAVSSAASLGRVYPEEEHPYRSAFQRDRDRIVHTTAFRRLDYKTQVFVYHEGDHYRNRLTHTVEVAQIGRSMARALGANEDLTEAICLAHDLGHPAFGHTGEATLNQLMTQHGGFDHQRQTMRIVSVLEDRYEDFPGLNLTYEVREGIVKHDTDYDVSDATGYEPGLGGTLECQISNLADEIAYNTADLEDGLRSGVLDYLDVRELGAWRMVLASLGEKPACDLPDKLRTRVIRRLIGVEISDAIRATASALADRGVRSVEDLRQAGTNLACFSDELHEVNVELKAFLMKNFYRHPRVVRMAYKANHMLTAIFNAYLDEPRQLPREIQARMAQAPERVICDYIAGMTDRFAILEYKRLFDPEARV
jgi:dGTPase